LPVFFKEQQHSPSFFPEWMATLVVKSWRSSVSWDASKVVYCLLSYGIAFFSSSTNEMKEKRKQAAMD
jgi:hypothetical protein